MNARDAKREACRRAASCLSTAMESGWPMWDDGADDPKYPTDADGRRVADALNELIAELDRRGHLAPIDNGSSRSGDVTR